MARKRKPEPFWREARKSWYVQFGAKQVKLDPDEATAYRLYHELMAKPTEERVPGPAFPTPSSDLVLPILDAFLEWTLANQAEKTFQWHRDHVKRFLKGIPKTLTVADLRPYHVSRVMDSHPEWSASTKNGFARSIQRAFKWAEGQGLIDKSPIGKVEKPTPTAREVVVTTEEFQDLLSRFPDQKFQDLLITAWETGCRPQELMNVEAANVDAANGRWVFKANQSKGKKSPRVVYLSDRAAEITRRLADVYPTGKLFRNENGQAWTKDAVNCRFVRKSKSLGRKLCLYHLRHSFAQRMLLAGIDAMIVSMWMGHKDVSTLAKTYQHLQQRPEFLHAKLKQANGQAERESASTPLNPSSDA